MALFGNKTVVVVVVIIIIIVVFVIHGKTLVLLTIFTYSPSAKAQGRRLNVLVGQGIRQLLSSFGQGPFYFVRDRILSATAAISTVAVVISWPRDGALSLWLCHAVVASTP